METLIARETLKHKIRTKETISFSRGPRPCLRQWHRRVRHRSVCLPRVTHMTNPYHCMFRSSFNPYKSCPTILVEVVLIEVLLLLKESQTRSSKFLEDCYQRPFICHVFSLFVYVLLGPNNPNPPLTFPRTKLTSSTSRRLAPDHTGTVSVSGDPPTVRRCEEETV